jgi:hypothetical protein
MERITVSRGSPSDSLPAPLCITIRVKPRTARVLVLAAGIGICTLGAVRIDLLFIPPDPSTWQSVGLGALAGLGALLAGRLAWILGGRETFQISPLALSVRRSVGPFALRRTYRFADLGDACIIPRSGTLGLPPWQLMCLETEQEAIVLRHRERYVRLARDLDKAEGAYLLSAIRIWMHDQ